MKKYLLDLPSEQLKNALGHLVKQDYRIEQIRDWIYVKKADSFDKCLNLPKDLREKLSEKFIIRTLKAERKEKSLIDGTIRYTFKTLDKKYFYAVFLPSKVKGKNSVCISSQIGCQVSCAFCYSGQTKFIRNLTRGEILEQILTIENDTGEKISGVLFMGMGEPLLNFNNVLSAVKSLLSKKEFNIGKRHITLSTVGVIPCIKKLTDENVGIRLALSIHAVDDKQRKRLMPNNMGFEISSILLAANQYLKKTKSRLTIEFILLRSINDLAADAHKLARLLKKNGLLNPNVQINLIPFNPVKNSQFQPPSQETLDRFKNILKVNGFTVNIRQAKGADIGAACGQLGA
ncbi:MAG: 23S rRNA (adenine(2503)-C(2))-methyltransferase RlmN [Elusimicrobiota bacterium]|jgi:23S rRNA (adenine2503-C2)-methyltransferase|nr:23S rRNA (adenine(2503)-C(2))-methyltransferase RlmN [Elusimicrobiota bacterium]